MNIITEVVDQIITSFPQKVISTIISSYLIKTKVEFDDTRNSDFLHVTEDTIRVIRYSGPWIPVLGKHPFSICEPKWFLQVNEHSEQNDSVICGIAQKVDPNYACNGELIHLAFLKQKDIICLHLSHDKKTNHTTLNCSLVRNESVQHTMYLISQKTIHDSIDVCYPFVACGYLSQSIKLVSEPENLQICVNRNEIDNCAWSHLLHPFMRQDGPIYVQTPSS
jgi:hypothetical protein